MSEKKITIMPCGPYEVSGDVPLKQAVIGTNDAGESVAWKQGKQYETEETYHLCRCGHSKNKPFCDGSHVDENFYGDEVASRKPYKEQAKHYVGPGVDLLDCEGLCGVARFCDPGLQVWGYVDASDDPENEKMAIREACNCPTGRLTILRKDGTLVEPELDPEIDLVEDVAQDHRGPLWVKGGIEIHGEEGPYEVRNRVALCRCGESNNMPFCDASHLNCPHMEGLDK